MTRLQFVAYLRFTLIPDLQDSDMHATAEDFETAIQIIARDAEVLHDARKALRKAMPHTPPDTTAALCGEVIDDINEILP